MNFKIQPIYYVKSKNPIFYEILYKDDNIPNNILFHKSNDLLDIFLFNKALEYIKKENKEFLYTINLSTSALMKNVNYLNNILINNKNIYIELLEKDIDNYEYIDSGFNKKVILDDFGTINSNFDRIIHFKPFAIKFDRVMFQFSNKVLLALREEFENRNITCIFEKIENEEEYKKAYETGFYFMQGFYIDNLFNFNK